MTLAPDSMIAGLREWLEKGGEVEAAEAIQGCEIHTYYVDELVELGGGDRMWSLFDAEIAAPRELYEPTDDQTTDIQRAISKALRAHGEAEGIALRSVRWVPRFGASQRSPAQESADEILGALETSHVLRAWRKALHRLSFDPDGAITASKAMLEAVCKEILHAKGVGFSQSAELPTLCHLTFQQLRLAPQQHEEKLWRQTLGNCQAIVGALAAIRNDHGDAHGPVPNQEIVSPIHAELAVNLAGSVAAFVISVWQQLEEDGPDEPSNSI